MIKAHWMAGSTHLVPCYEEAGLLVPKGYERTPVSYAGKVEQGPMAVISLWLAGQPDQPGLCAIVLTQDFGGWLLQMGTEKVDQREYPADRQPPGLRQWVPDRSWTAISFSIAVDELGSLDWCREKLRRALEIIHERLETVSPRGGIVAALLET